jgi:hypothetical protein
MLSEPDLSRLTDAYRDAERQLGHTERVAARLGLLAPNATALAETILNDLDIDEGGVRWWTDPPKREAIQIADHAFQAAGAPLGLLLEARLHLSALERIWLESEERWIAEARRTGRLTVPESDAPIEDVPVPEENLHLAGFLRCIAQVLDCLAAAVIVVADLPSNAQKAAWPLSERKITKFLELPDGQPAREVLDRIWGLVDAAGPQDWST